MKPVDMIVLIVVVIVVIFALKPTIKHLKGEGPCCKGNCESGLSDKSLKGRIIGSYTVTISGMHCQNCANHIASRINEITGASAKVSLRKNQVVVSYDRLISKEMIIQAIKKAGYDVVAIEN